MNRKKWRIKLEYFLPILIFLIFGLIIFLTESMLRTKYPDLLVGDEFEMFHTYDSRLSRWQRKNFSHDYVGAKVTINKKGLRDTDLPYKNINGNHRIVVLGDSVAWGFGVGDGDTFCDFMEKNMEDTDVINMSVSGYGTGEEYLLLKHEGLRYKPDKVILFFYIGNDIVNNSVPESWESFPANFFYLDKGELKIMPFELDLARKIGIFLNERSYIMNFIHKKVLKRGPDKETNWVKALNDKNFGSITINYEDYSNYTYLEPDTECLKEQEYEGTPLLRPIKENYYSIELTKAIILKIKELCKKNDIELIVALSPFRAQMAVSSCAFKYPLNKELLNFLNANNIEAIDLLSLFLNGQYTSDQIFTDEAHFIPNGHKIVAELIIRQLAKINKNQ